MGIKKSLKEWAIAKALNTAFAVGLKNETPEKVADILEDLLDKQVGEVKSEKIQADFEYFLVEFAGRIIKRLRRDR